MSEVSPVELRIYCICGQKMKVTRNMFGKPGKCVACRQKIRIPTRDEFPGDSGVIRLKDHPEFLRNPSQEIAPPPEPASDLASDLELEVEMMAIEEGDESSALSAVPFVLFEPIGQLCNYEAQIDAHLQALRENKKIEFDKATLMSYRGLARKSRNHLEKRIRDELVEIGTELQSLEDANNSAVSALRSGDLEHVAYSKKVLPLRKRREVLTYRQHNLRGWLATDNPPMAGGHTEVSLADVPVESTEAPFPLDTEMDCLPIEHAVLKLEEALRRREKADKRLNELHHMNLRGEIPADALKIQRADCEAERERARSGVAFYRSRLQQIIQDCEDDSGALKAHQEVKQADLAEAVITKRDYEDLEEALFRAQVDIKRARNMATRALNANAVSDVPNPKGTFLERLARPGSLKGLGVDSWLAWVGSALFLAVIFVPIVDAAPGGNAAVFQVFTLGLFVGASVLGLCATILLRLPRALALNAVWLGLTVAGAAYFQYESHATGMAGSALRAGAPWWTSIGGAVLLAGWAAGGLAAIISAFPIAPLRWMGLASVAIGGALAAFILSGFGGMLRPDPAIASMALEVNPRTGNYSVVVPLVNGGRRAFWVGGDRVALPAATTYVLERQAGPESWQDAGRPVEASVDGVKSPLDLHRGLEVPGGAVASIHYQLSPGTYRVRVVPLWREDLQLQHTFQLDAVQPEVNPAPEPSRPRPVEDAEVGSSQADAVTVELKGVVDGRDSQPKFSIVMTMPNGDETREQYGLGDTLHGEWRLSEFSPAHNTLTITDGERLIILERGKEETIN